MEALGIKVDAMDCLSLAEEAGSSKAVNIVLMGRLSKYFDIPVEKWQKAIEECVPQSLLNSITRHLHLEEAKNRRKRDHYKLSDNRRKRRMGNYYQPEIETMR